jgi:hypothetical protein
MIEQYKNTEKERAWQEYLKSSLDSKSDYECFMTGFEAGISHQKEITDLTLRNETSDWLWRKFMDFCKSRGRSPASFNDLFEIVGEFRKNKPKENLNEEKIDAEIRIRSDKTLNNEV